MYSGFHFRTPFGSQRINGFQTMQKSEGEHFYATFSSFWHTWSWKTYLLVKSKILGLFVNPLTADAKYSRHVTGTLQQPIQMHLS